MGDSFHRRDAESAEGAEMCRLEIGLPGHVVPGVGLRRRAPGRPPADDLSRHGNGFSAFSAVKGEP